MPTRLLLAGGDVVVAEQLRVARSVRARMKGLLGGAQLVVGDGLLLTPCKQVHTFGMRYPIDVVFCDQDWQVTNVIRDMKPRRVSRIEWKARHTIELPRGAADGIRAGDRLVLDEAQT
jgi:uncharacterized membrane protein (UPF0127 family)